MRDTFRYLYKDSSNFINSCLLGIKDDLTKEEKDMFSKTGTSHVLAISGLHTGILCVLIAYIIRGINKIYKLYNITTKSLNQTDSKIKSGLSLRDKPLSQNRITIY